MTPSHTTSNSEQEDNAMSAEPWGVLADEGKRYALTEDAGTTLMAHGWLLKREDGAYEFPSDEAAWNDPGSAGVGYTKPRAVRAVIRAALVTELQHSRGAEAVDIAALVADAYQKGAADWDHAHGQFPGNSWSEGRADYVRSVVDGISASPASPSATGVRVKALEPLTDEAVERVLSLLDVYAPDVFNVEMAANVLSRSLEAVQQFPAPASSLVEQP